MRFGIYSKATFNNVSGAYVRFLVDDYADVAHSIEYNCNMSVRLKVHTPHKAMTAEISNGTGKLKVVELPGGETFDGVIYLPFLVKKCELDKPWPYVLLEFFSILAKPQLQS